MKQYTLRKWQSLLSPRGFEDVCPLIRVVELRCELCSKIGVCEVWRVVAFHEISNGRISSSPVIPKPFADKTGNRKNSPMNEYAELSFIVPCRKRSLVQRIPFGLVPVWSRSGNYKRSDATQKSYRRMSIHLLWQMLPCEENQVLISRNAEIIRI